jgi:hypothetical protein
MSRELVDHKYILIIDLWGIDQIAAACGSTVNSVNMVNFPIQGNWRFPTPEGARCMMYDKYGRNHLSIREIKVWNPSSSLPSRCLVYIIFYSWCGKVWKSGRKSYRKGERSRVKKVGWFFWKLSKFGGIGWVRF